MLLKSPIRIVVADDFPIFRKGLVQSINQKTPDLIHIVGEAANGEGLLSEVERKKPDVVLTDIRMPIINGIEASRTINKNFPLTPVIALSMSAEVDIIYEMFETGAKGYVAKNADIDEVIQAIETVYSGEMYYCSSSSFNLIKKIGPSKYNQYRKNKNHHLTQKEIQLIKLVCLELTTKEIANKMNISPRTVEEYSRNIKEKIGAKNLVGIALYAVRNNLVSINGV